MQAYKLIKKKPSVIYRWLRRRRSFVHAVTMACALVVLPLGIAGGIRLSHFIDANSAMASPRAELPRESALIAALAFGGQPENIEKLRESDFLALFRAPDLDRRDGGTKIWQYRTASCVLDIYFDENAATGGAGRVVHYEIRPRQVAAFGNRGKVPEGAGAEDAVDPSGCLKEIARSGRA